MYKILLPTDFSDNAQCALDYAVHLFAKEACNFYLLHAYHDAPSGSKSKVEMEKDLYVLADDQNKKAQHPEHHFTPVFVVDSLVNALNVSSIDLATDYIIMGTQGVSSILNIFMGSNAVNVIKQLNTCPIITVPAEYHFTAPEEVALANDYRHRFSTDELSSLIKLAKLWDAKVSVVHILSKKSLDEEQQRNKKVLKSGLKEINHDFIEAQMDLSVTSSLVKLEKANPRIAMLALLKTEHGFFDTLLHEPVIRKMAFNTELPLLVLPQLT